MVLRRCCFDVYTRYGSAAPLTKQEKTLDVTHNLLTQCIIYLYSKWPGGVQRRKNAPTTCCSLNTLAQQWLLTFRPKVIRWHSPQNAPIKYMAIGHCDDGDDAEADSLPKWNIPWERSTKSTKWSKQAQDKTTTTKVKKKYCTKLLKASNKICSAKRQTSWLWKFIICYVLPWEEATHTIIRFFFLTFFAVANFVSLRSGRCVYALPICLFTSNGGKLVRRKSTASASMYSLTYENSQYIIVEH